MASVSANIRTEDLREYKSRHYLWTNLPRKGTETQQVKNVPIFM
jgi:hypothetical protein